MSSDRFPALEEYIAGLPDGLASHPQCQAKASLYRSLIDTKGLEPDDVDALPPDLRSLVIHPVPISSWIPEVHSPRPHPRHVRPPVRLP